MCAGRRGGPPRVRQVLLHRHAAGLTPATCVRFSAFFFVTACGGLQVVNMQALAQTAQKVMEQISPADLEQASSPPPLAACVLPPRCATVESDPPLRAAVEAAGSRAAQGSQRDGPAGPPPSDTADGRRCWPWGTGRAWRARRDARHAQRRSQGSSAAAGWQAQVEF
jgi:hypothetical protein